jgi:hypothetical protein
MINIEPSIANLGDIHDRPAGVRPGSNHVRTNCPATIRCAHPQRYNSHRLDNGLSMHFFGIRMFIWRYMRSTTCFSLAYVA